MWGRACAKGATIAGCAAVLVAAGCGSGSSTGTTTVTVPTTGLATMTASVGDLDEPLPPKVLAKAMSIVKRDRVFADVVGAAPFRMSGRGRWGRIDGPDLGVWLELQLRRSVGVDAVLPYADIPPDAPTKGECHEPYRQTWRRYRARDVRRVSFLVDLRRRTVADIDTDASVFEIGRALGRPYPSCRAG